jgi:hypothetical protein
MPGRGTASYTDPFVALAADRAWRADDAVDNGSVTTSLPSYVGSPLSLTALGNGQTVKSPSADLGGRLAIACDGLPASNGYSAVALAGSPTNFTVARVVRITADNSGPDALTDGGAVNTGVSSLYVAGDMRSRRVSTDASSPQTLPLSMVVVSVYTTSGFSSYVNSFTPVTSADAEAFVGTTFQVMSLSLGGLLTMTGQWATSGYWLRALSQAEVINVLRNLGLYYGIAVS